MQIAKQRLYLNKDKSALVAADNEAASTLYCTPGDTIPDSAVERFGLVDGELKKRKSGSGQKENKPAANKENKPGSNKNKSPSGDKTTSPKPLQLTDIGGIGPATAKLLGEAGVKSVAALAEIDLANPPNLENLPPVFEWEAAVDAAKALIKKEG